MSVLPSLLNSFTNNEEKNSLCSPLKTFDEVMNWKCDNVNVCWAEKVNEINERTKYGLDNTDLFSDSKPSPTLQISPDNAPKTLVCHDMMGGYREDRYVEDTEVTEEPYRFFHWSSIDVFVYFSHFLLTIPPIGWINAGHLHGVSVLGTLITENEIGEHICKCILKDIETAYTFARKLAEICQHYGFDGYLLNIENKIDPVLMENFRFFVFTLQQNLKEVSCGRKSLLIWYDSVIEPSGELKWQNKLNELNKYFFSVCDGIYLNYSWTLEDLQESLETAGDRKKDVYVGIDVFGRNCYGGGGFNTVEALQVIRKKGLSAAIFAPGWTYELDRDDFLSREYTFWKKLQPWLVTYGPSTLPFRTTFCQGFGLKLYKEGDVHSDTPWFNLSKQNYQLACCTCPEEKITSTELPSCMKVCTYKAFEGGSCLEFYPCIDTVIGHSCRLLACDFASFRNDTTFHVTFGYYFTQELEDDDIKLMCTVVMASKDIVVSNKEKNFNKCSTHLFNDIFGIRVDGVLKTNEQNITCKDLPDKRIHFPNGWRKRTFELNHGGNMSIREIRLQSYCKFPVLLGLLEITSSS